jgi:hypothetical protein
MPPNAFIGKATKPTAQELTDALGPANAHWDQRLAELVRDCNLVTHEWNSYSPKAGWSLRLKGKERNILYLSPCRGAFTVSFALGDKAVQAARSSRLPARVIQIIDTSKRYAEGTGVRIDVKGPQDIPAVKKLVAIKLEN